ncbi:carbonic anhydrase/acetyltransferase-like protein (isoleucine patch superfamily) [Hoeflea halophila]|uniref:Carbonic anhydrase/acetyltransferase-like protein (Isoleucine patch superfamily) n=1 Tax=Hoeflea halophila TaxID=714899 RepID=A0A286HKT7_9HYPH|nr:gamma carbonic anhydrase family protein [Hoeflea halophila]SOE08337.1 carbonic anhydrase/acetyltransferase-like protein (isoleucine patch superfamily) [Hoeflea halophila]
MAIYSLDEMQPVLPAEFYFVADSAQVIGNVILKEGAGIWFGAVLRGDNEPITVGKGSNIQENCVLHTDMGFPLLIGEGCTIGHAAILHGCTIGNNSLVGMGATVLNGATIGDNCLIGAGALVTEGKVIPDNSMVLGSPAKVVKTLGEDAAAMLKLSASHYVENARRFAKGLKRID